MKYIVDNSINDCMYIEDVLYALCKVSIKYVLYPYDDEKKDGDYILINRKDKKIKAESSSGGINININ